MTLRWHWGIGIAAVYVVFAGSTIGFVTFAMRQQVDLVSGDYYEQSLAYDDRMAAVARADALGEGFSVAADPAGTGIVVTWPAEMRIESGHVTFYRAADARADRQFTASPDGDGRQHITAGALARGAWIVRVDWTAGGETFFADRRVMLP
jgi:nitrogen fixation protein FixH